MLAARLELTRRRAACTSLLGFTSYTLPRYQVAHLHEKIAAKLEAVERGEISRLMIFMPPRHGKSELASKRFPAWFMGRNPASQFISASYNSDLAGDFGRSVRNIIASPEFSVLFPGVSLAQDSRAQDRWNTNHGGSYVAAGVGTAVTGRGADILSIDDPVKDRAEAESATMRDRAWNWYTSTAYTRLMPGGRVVVTQTRWHEDDLAGRLLAQQAAGGDQWDVLELPAISDAGTALWPEAYPLPVLERIRGAVGTRDFTALYQQRPAPDEGTLFRKEWIKRGKVPANLRVYGASDYALTADGGDFTVHAVAGLDAEHRLWLPSLWRQQATSDVTVDAFCSLVKQWKPLRWAEETGQIHAALGPFINQRMRTLGAHVARELFPTRIGKKEVRAASIIGRMAVDGLWIPEDAPWAADFEAELLSFPAGKHDDQVDAIGLIGQLLDKMAPAARTKPEGPPRDSWDLSFGRKRDSGGTSWKVA